MDQKTRFIADYLRRSLSISELCTQFGISRKTGYKWIDRYLHDGPQGLEDLSRAPYTSPHRTPSHIEAALIELRGYHPSWGAKKLLSVLEPRHRGWLLPARSTTCEILKRHALVAKRRHRRAIGDPGKPSSTIAASNDVWCADFKGQFKTADGQYCFPLTVTDAHSRSARPAAGAPYADGGCVWATEATLSVTHVARPFLSPICPTGQPHTS